MKNSLRRSPLFYVGDKFKLMPQLLNVFPKEVSVFYEPFSGGGTVFLNVSAKKYVLNDIDKHLINIHHFLISSAKDHEAFFKRVEKIIKQYDLSCSYKKDVVPDSLKKQFKKTYYARFNKEGYELLRKRVNNNKTNDPLILYVLLIYGFNRMLRFNGGGKFNLPVGNVDFNKNVEKALLDYFDFVKDKKIQITTNDFRDFFKRKRITHEDFIYLDPPYLITSSEYNKIWNHHAEADLLDILNKLDKKGVRFALSNVTHYRGATNDRLIQWAKNYNVHEIKSNYISYHNNGKKEIREVLVTNY